MFSYASSFRQDLFWDMSNVTDISSMFSFSGYNGDVTTWDTGSVTNMSGVFYSCFGFNQDISGWDTSNVTNMSMLLRNTSFNHDIGNWDISSLTSISRMFWWTGLSNENYDNILIGWATDTSGSDIDGDDDVPPNISLHAFELKYCKAANVRASLIKDHGWLFSDAGLADDCGFEMTWKTTTTDETITIPTTGGGYDYFVSWGDDGGATGGMIGDAIDNQTGDATHTYATPGTYTVTIYGEFPRIYFNNAGDKLKVLTVEQWGSNTSWTSMEDAFYGCANLTVPAIDAPNLSSVTSTNRMFYGSGLITGGTGMNTWDMSTILSTDEMFQEASTFNGNISGWNVENVTTMEGMFKKASAFNGDLANWNVSSVITMESMFQEANLFNGNISNWTTSALTKTKLMFSEADSFRQDLFWDMSNVTDMSEMFYDSGYNGNVTTWDTGSVTNMSRVFYSCFDFNQDISGWDTSNVTDMSMIIRETSFNYDIGNWDISNVIDISNMFWDTGLSNENYDNILIGWATDTSGGDNDGVDDIPLNLYLDAPDLKYCKSATARASLINDHGWTILDLGLDDGCSFVMTWETTTIDETITIPTTEGGYDYFVNWGDGETTADHTGDATHTYTTPGTYTVTIYGEFPRIYFNDAGDKLKILTVEQWGSRSWTSMESAFYGCANLTVPAIDAPIFAVSPTGGPNGTPGEYFLQNMFRGATSFNQNINHWDVHYVTHMNSMFRGATSFNQPLDSWNVSEARDMRRMFQSAIAFDQDLSNWDVSNVYQIFNMFTNATLSTTNYDALLNAWSQLPNLVNNLTFHGGNSQYCEAEAARALLMEPVPTGHNWTIIDGGKACKLSLDIDVFLQGAALNPFSGEQTLMRDDLRIGDVGGTFLPTLSPYTDSISCESSVLTVTGQNAIVDWIWIELRDETDNKLMVDSQSALLQRDGDIVGVDGVSDLAFDQTPNNYYVVVKHRNHLGIMSASPIALSSTTTLIDFTDAANQITYGTNAQTTYGMPSGKVGMWAGDANGDGKVIFLNTGAESVAVKQLVLDRSAIESPFGASIFYKPSGYYDEDLNMNGEVVFLNAENELINIKDNVLAHPSNQVFNSVFFVINTQLP